MTTATVDAPTRLIVAEMFGPTLQGEGPSAGRMAAFVRLSRCNLDCSWCDTPYTWDWSRFSPREQATALPVDAVADWVLGVDAPMLVITGGEPLLQQRGLVPVAARCHGRGRRVEIETNGTVAPLPNLVEVVDQFTVSPKLSGSGVAAARGVRPEVLAPFVATGKAVFKFVIATPADLDELVDLAPTLAPAPIWVMPQGTDAVGVVNGLRALAEPAIAHGWNLSTRLHVLLWGDERGR